MYRGGIGIVVVCIRERQREYRSKCLGNIQRSSRYSSCVYKRERERERERERCGVLEFLLYRMRTRIT